MFIVTGGAGFIGSAFLSKLNEEGIFDVLVVDNLGTANKWKNLSGKSYSDYLHKDQFRQLLEQGYDFGQVEAVFHFGACSSTTETDAEYMMDNNYRYSREVADWALNQQARFIYASSAATYGNGEHGFSDDVNTIPLLRPLNIYGYSKQLFDLWILNNGLGETVAGLKFFNVFGPNEYHKGEQRSVIHKAVGQILSTGRLKLFKSYREGIDDGQQNRDFVYIKDCLEIIWWLYEHPEVNGIFNLGSGHARTWNDLANSVFSALDRPASVDFIDMPVELRPNYQYFTEANMEKLANAGCPWKFTSLEEAVTDYVCNYLVPEEKYL